MSFQSWAGLQGTAHQELTLRQFPGSVVPKRKPVSSVCSQRKWAQWVGRFQKAEGRGGLCCGRHSLPEAAPLRVSL